MCFDVEGLEQSNPIRRRVWCSETGALSKGYALCYDRDYGTAANATESRDKRCQLPDATNNQWFAGVLAKDYPANANGQMVEIHEPGGVAYVYSSGAATINGGGLFNFQMDTSNATGTTTITKGQFNPNFAIWGRGGVQFMQTTTGAGLVLAKLLDGPQTGGNEQITTPATPEAGAISPFGVTSITTAAGNNTSAPATLAAGTFIGQTKVIKVTAVATACKINFGAGKVQTLAGGALSQYLSASAADTLVLRWNGTNWTPNQYVLSLWTAS